MITATAATAVTATFLTNEVITKTISFTVSNIYILAKNIFYTDSSIDLYSLDKLEKKLDLLYTIKVYDLWIQEISSNVKSPSLHEAILHFKNGLEDIHSILKNIDEKIKIHKEKWFSWYRSISFQNEMEELQSSKMILDQRFNLIQRINGMKL